MLFKTVCLLFLLALCFESLVFVIMVGTPPGVAVVTPDDSMVFAGPTLNPLAGFRARVAFHRALYR